MSPSSAAKMPALRRVATDRSGRFYETPDGDLLPSVTNILSVLSKPALVAWAAKIEREMVIEAAADLFEDAPAQPKMSRTAFIASLSNRLGKTKAHVKELQKATEIGSQAHALIEWNLRKELGQVVGDEPRITDKATWAFMAWEDWRRTVDLKPIWIEQAVYSKTHGFAGTLDLVAELNLKDEAGEYGRVTAVIDWKTGKAIYAESKLQNAAYSWALFEMGHAPKPPHGLVLRLPKIESDPNFEPMVVHQSEMDGLFRAFLAARDLWTWQQKQEAARREPAKAAVEVPTLPETTAQNFSRVMASQLPKETADELAARRQKLKEQADLLLASERTCSKCGGQNIETHPSVANPKERICLKCFQGGREFK